MLLTFAAALALPASAGARPNVEVQKRSLHLSLQARASNGYQLRLETLGHKRVNLAFSKGGVFVGYTTIGRVNRHRIRADFGRLGRVSVRLRAKRVPFPRPRGRNPQRNRSPRRDCRGRRPMREVGSFRGRIRFKGERGFTTVSTDSARGEMQRYYRRVCKLTPARGRRQPAFEAPRLNTITVGGRAANRAVFLRAVGLEGGPSNAALGKGFGSLTTAGTIERRAGVRIDRLAMTEGDARSLIVSPDDKRPVTATVALPKPFAGKAKLIQAAGSPTSWTGSLRVHLPGAGAVPLTGPRLQPVFCRVGLFSELATPCVRRAEGAIPEPPRINALMALLQGSGSHSQALAEARLSWSR